MPAELRIEITGAAAIQARLQRLGTEAPQALGAALYRQGERIMTEAKRRTPVDTGTLKASGAVLQPVVRGREVTVTLGFGGPAVGYAIHVHENLTARHPVGQAKFLESALFEASRTLAADLARDLDAALARLGR